MKIRIKNDEIAHLLDAESLVLPKYASQLLNLANQTSQGTRPANVGQMSELIKLFNGRRLNDWEQWYTTQYPDAIRIAAGKIRFMIEGYKKVLEQIDDEMVEAWVRDLVIVKTFVGLRFHEAILMRVADELKCEYEVSSPADESKGIDGYIGRIPVSIKPDSYKTMATLPEQLPADIIYYTKRKDGIVVEFDERKWLE